MIVMRETVNAKQTQVHPGNPAGVAAEADRPEGNPVNRWSPYFLSILTRADSAVEINNLDELSNSGAAIRLYGEGQAIGPPGVPKEQKCVSHFFAI
jgi:hypothetical protein